MCMIIVNSSFGGNMVNEKKMIFSGIKQPGHVLLNKYPLLQLDFFSLGLYHYITENKYASLFLWHCWISIECNLEFWFFDKCSLVYGNSSKQGSGSKWRIMCLGFLPQFGHRVCDNRWVLVSCFYFCISKKGCWWEERGTLWSLS